ncbi:MAG: hypothetical protein M1358_23025, partial [Chloroflexi bacterium]|nr:hypothetical protein [Chloroflexota bacterium]
MSELPTQLARPFKIIAFDWDGTAVTGRSEDIGRVRELIERLLGLRVYVVVITGTSFPNIDRQLSAAIRGPHKRHLYISTNRGSEVYGFAPILTAPEMYRGFDAQSNPVLVWRRIATPDENRLLTEIADAVRQQLVASTGLDIRVIYRRLNRRKIDLIPLPEWRDPPKSEIGRLLQAVEARLKGAGFAGALREVFGLAEREIREKGLKDARITSDVKHVEIGLTDKSDAIDWVMRELAEKKGIPPEDILIGGDEFGPIAGFEGSDHKMVTPLSREAVFVSVGLEPGGVPPEVIHIGGGPARFTELLAYQVALHEHLPLHPASSKVASDPLELPATPTSDPSWLLIEEGFNLAREHEIESLFAVANGYIGTRGSLAEGSSLSSPATFIAGVFDINPKSDAIPELAVVPDWVRLHIIVDGHELKLEEGEVLEHRRVLDLRQGILWREWRHEDLAGRVTRLRFQRLASLADRHVLLQSVLLTPENYSGRITLESLLEQPARGEDRSLALKPESIPAPSTPAPPGPPPYPQSVALLNLSTSGTGTTVSFASASRLFAEDGQCIRPDIETGQGRTVERWEWEAEIGKAYRLDRLLSVYSSHEVQLPAEQAVRHLEHLLSEGVERVVADHVKAWDSRWEASGIEVVRRTPDSSGEGDEEAARVLRFAIYHLVSAANPEDERISIGARALTGESYKGHVFWDTEIYVLPFYTFTYPSAARALLMYRYHTLPAAQEKAHNLGYRGA